IRSSSSPAYPLAPRTATRTASLLVRMPRPLRAGTRVAPHSPPRGRGRTPQRSGGYASTAGAARPTHPPNGGAGDRSGPQARRGRSALRELISRASAALAVLLALLLARVAREEAAALERRAQLLVELLEGARDAVAQRVGLPCDAAAVDARVHVVAAFLAARL